MNINIEDLYGEAAKAALPQKRLTGSEREALVQINVALDVLMKARGELKARVNTIPGGNRDIGLVIAKLTKMLGYFAATVPKEQLKTYLNNLKMASITIGVMNPATSARDEDHYGMWLPYKTINELFKGCHDKCLMCTLDTEGQRRCALRKALDSIPNDLAQNEGNCPYYGEM